MDCQCCQKKPARIRVCDVEENNIAEQYNVCPDCFSLIKRYMFDMARPLMPTEDVIREVQTLLGEGDKSLAVSSPPGMLAPSGEAVPVCPECGMTLSEFKARGRFGCPRDYEVFAEHLDPLFERIHEAHPPRHEGRLPRQEGAAREIVDRARRLASLKSRLDAAVAEENYELAAQLRDEINGLEPAQEGRKA
jgi:protein arginine kinase activator